MVDDAVTRRFLLQSGAAVAGSAVTWPLTAAASGRRPNLLLIVTDDQRWNAFGAYPNRDLVTPTMDRMAAGGLIFDNCFVTTSICPTSRASIVSGTYASRHKVFNFTEPLGRDMLAQSFPALLRRAGYQTGFVGKWGLGGPQPIDQFDYWGGFAEVGFYYTRKVNGARIHMTDFLEMLAVEFLERIDPDRPFALMVSFKAPHSGDTLGEAFEARPQDLARNRDIHPAPPPTMTQADFERMPPFLRSSEGRTRYLERFATPEEWEDSVKKYYALITGVDDAIAGLFSVLRRRGIYDRTWSFLVSDNGFAIGDRGLSDKWDMYEESIRVPLIVQPPAVGPWMRGRRRHEMVLNIDLAPTFCELAGIERGRAMQGQSLVPLFDDRKVEWRNEWFYEHRLKAANIPDSIGVRTTRWKYTRYIGVEPAYEMLFDLTADPLERNNLAGLPQAAVELERLRRTTDTYASAVV